MARVRIKVTEGPSAGALLTFTEADNVLEVGPAISSGSCSVIADSKTVE
jgi:hypothetical protein